MLLDNQIKDLSGPTVVVIEPRTFIRDCLIKSIMATSEYQVIGISAVADLANIENGDDIGLYVLCAGHITKIEDVGRAICRLTQSGVAPIVVLSEGNEIRLIIEALQNGARGYIPLSMPINMAIEAIRFVMAGGTFVPADYFLIAARRGATDASGALQPPGQGGMFTARQTAVIQALRRGKANKMIAYELNMCESTVKVHVRNIMRKLKAKNRTQVACLANELFGSEAV